MPVHISKKFQETFASPSRHQIRSSECQQSVRSPQPPKTPIKSIQTRAPPALGSCLPSVSLLFLWHCTRKLGLVQASLRLGLLVKYKPSPVELITLHLKAGEGTCLTSSLWVSWNLSAHQNFGTFFTSAQEFSSTIIASNLLLCPVQSWGWMEVTSDMQMAPPYGRKQRRIKEPLDVNERGE